MIDFKSIKRAALRDCRKANTVGAVREIVRQELEALGVDMDASAGGETADLEHRKIQITTHFAEPARERWHRRIFKVK